MLTMAVGTSDDVDPADAIASAIEQCRIALDGAKPQAGILFTAFDSFAPATLDAVRAAFPGVSIMGATSAAEISSPGGYQEDSLTLALFVSADVEITAGAGAGLGIDVDAACRAAAAQALAATTREPKVAVVLAEGFVVDPKLTLNAMARALPGGVTIVGGTSARRDFVTVTPTYQFCNDIVARDGVAVLLFSGPIVFSTAVGTGWRTIGVSGIVTQSEYGALHQIDGRPAIEFLARYLDVTGPASYGNPLAVIEAGGEQSYLRAVQGSDPDSGSVRLAGSIPVGATVQLTTANTDEILAGTKDALARAAADFPAGSRPEAALIFSCSVRKFLLGSRTRVEAEMASTQYGATMPLAGLYCYGEMGPVRGTATSRYLNETFVTILLDVSPEADSKDGARLARRVSQLEATLLGVEQIRDTNARLLDRLRGELETERARSERLLLNVLPQPIIDRLNAGEGLIADRYDDVAVVFSDFVGFTEISSRLPVASLVASLNELFSAFDAACVELRVEKIKTIGDAYLAAAGLPGTNPDHLGAAADLALAMRAVVDAAGPPWQVRIGLHAGPAIAGVIGTSKFVYDLWGDAVNTASRLETSAPPGRIQVSGTVAAALAGTFDLEPRGAIELKGKGSTEAWFLNGRRRAAAR